MCWNKNSQRPPEPRAPGTQHNLPGAAPGADVGEDWGAPLPGPPPEHLETQPNFQQKHSGERENGRKPSIGKQA